MREIVLTDKNFETEVINADMPVLVDFWATWCSPCRMLAPIVAEIAEEYSGKIKVGKINVDEQQELAAKYNVMSIPMLIYFKNGKIAATSVGFRSKADVIATLGL